MNYLAIDYGQKRVGLAICSQHIISPLSPLKNDKNLYQNIIKTIDDHHINKVFVGICFGRFGQQTKDFLSQLQNMLKLKVEAVEETGSTIEADQIFRQNKKNKKKYKRQIDSVSACVILRRALGY